MTPDGSIVAWWDGSDLTFGCVVRDAGTRLNTVTARGRHGRVQASKVAFRLTDPQTSADPPEVRVERVSATIERRAEQVDVEALWELALDTSTVSPLSELAELALDEATEGSRCAVALALARDGLRFERKGSDWHPRPRETVERRLEQQELERRSCTRRRQALDELVRAAESGRPVDPDVEDVERYVDALEAFALYEAEASAGDRARAREALEATGGGGSIADACRLLERLGSFDDGENLAIRRHGLPRSFPPEVERAASVAIERAAALAGREDLTLLEAYTIDGPRTREIDDALSWQPIPGGDRLWVHVAEPVAFVEAGGVVDVEAGRRGTTHYFPDVRLPMLPPAIGEAAASLVRGELRPALSVRVDLDAGGEVLDFDLVPSLVRCSERLTYDEAERRIGARPAAEPTPLNQLDRVAERRQRRRVEEGAFVLELDALDVRLEDGAVKLTRERRGSPAQRLVSEAMILAGELTARYAIERGVPLVFRQQAAPEVDAPGEPVLDVVRAWALRRRMPPARVAPRPGRHAGLGLEAYAQTTSPIRRYLDLFNQRQLVAAIRGRPLVDDPGQLSGLAARGASSEARARRAEAEVRRYWVLRYLAGEAERSWDGTVVAGGPRPVVWLEELCFDAVVPALAGAEEGQRVSLLVSRVEPREGTVQLRPKGGS